MKKSLRTAILVCAAWLIATYTLFVQSGHFGRGKEEFFYLGVLPILIWAGWKWRSSAPE